MEGYFPLKLKRKDLEDVNDDFSDFSLSSPARKIRRLDAELPPIIEEEECEIPAAFDHSQRFDHVSSGGLKIEEVHAEPVNDERAIVLFNPTNTTPLLQSPSNFSLSVTPELLSRFRNEVLWSSEPNSRRVADDEADNSNSSSGNGCLAVVPWVPAQHCSIATPEAELPSQNNTEMMDDQEMEEATMDVDDTDNGHWNVNEGGGMSSSEGFHQMHCLIPQPPRNTTAPIVWYP